MSTLKKSVKRKLFESRASKLQKRIVKYLEPKNLLELEEELREILQVEKALLKLARSLSVNPQHLQQTIDDFLKLINLLQI